MALRVGERVEASARTGQDPNSQASGLRPTNFRTGGARTARISSCLRGCITGATQRKFVESMVGTATGQGAPTGRMAQRV